MQTLLIISPLTTFATAIEAALGVADFRVIAKPNTASAASLFARRAFDAVVVDIEVNGSKATRVVDEIRQLDPHVPIIIFAGETRKEWEEEAYLLGVSHVLDKPVRGPLLRHLLVRALKDADHSRSAQRVSADGPMATSSHATHVLARHTESTWGYGPVSGPSAPGNSFDAMRRLGAILAENLDVDAILRKSLASLREVAGVNRAVIFLRKHRDFVTDESASVTGQLLVPAHWVGHESSVLRHFALSLTRGLGLELIQHGRVIRSDGPEAHAQREIAREFSILSGRVAIPIGNREQLVGALVLDDRLSGAPFRDDELHQIFLWLEDLGQAITHCWRHEQVAASEALFDEILQGLTAGCIVIGANHGVLRANRAAIHMVKGAGHHYLDFGDLPQEIGSLIFSMIQHGRKVESFKWLPPETPGRVCWVSVSPFQINRSEGNGSAPHTARAALVTLEDITERENAARLESDASRAKLLRQMAEHMAHEVGNALTPISTHQQLLHDRGDDAEFRAEMSLDLAVSVRRIARITQQMNLLAREWDTRSAESVPLDATLRAAFEDGSAHYLAANRDAVAAGKIPNPKYQFTAKDPRIAASGDAKSLRHAFSEIFLNALQAKPDQTTIHVRAIPVKGSLGEVRLEFEDGGPGFTKETAARATEPFYSTRTVGMGLGLAVARRVIEGHGGVLECVADHGKGLVRATLPLSLLPTPELPGDRSGLSVPERIIKPSLATAPSATRTARS
jgi:signal transduction histidine kinase/CheY-like chemotaxis protein